MAVADRLVTIGGLGLEGDSDFPSAIETFECTDIGTGAACPLSAAGIDGGRCRFGAAVVDDKIVLLGGTNITDRINPVNSVEVVTVGTATVASANGADMPEALEGMAVATSGGRIYCIGGITADADGPRTSKAVYVYYP